MTFPGRLAKRLSCPVAVLLAVGAFALVFMPVVPYQPSCPGTGTVDGPLSKAFVLAVSDQLTLRGMTFAVYRTTYKDKTYGDREDVPEHWREHRTWNIHTTILHAWTGTWLPTAQCSALIQALEDGWGVTRAVIDERITEFGDPVDEGRHLFSEDCALVRAVAIAAENRGGTQEFLARSGWIPNVEETVKIESGRLSNPQLRWSYSDAEVDWGVEYEKDHFGWPIR